jgi:hypothetical protein
MSPPFDFELFAVLSQRNLGHYMMLLHRLATALHSDLVLALSRDRVSQQARMVCCCFQADSRDS